MPLQNTFTLDVDFKKSTHINEPVVTQNDEVTFVLNVFDDDMEFDLSAVSTFTLVSLRPDRQSVMSLGAKTGTNQVTFALGSTEISKIGKINAVIQLYDVDGRISTLPFTYQVLKDPVEDYVPSTDEQTLIELVLGQGPVILADAKQATVDAKAVSDNSIHLGEYDNESLYKNRNEVSFAGSSYIAKQDSLGIPPVINGEINTDFWALSARKGLGDVNSVNGKLPDGNGDVQLNFSGLATKIELRALDDEVTANFEQRGINIKELGIVDDSAAIKKAIEMSLQKFSLSREQNVSIYLPAGVYSINLANIFSDFDFTALGLSTSTRVGIKFVGDGKHATTLKLITNGQEKWFYDNKSINSQKFEHLFFAHMGFDTDDTSKGHGFKQWSQGGEKQFRFFDCHFNLGTIMQYEGTGNADLNRFLMCSIYAFEDAFIHNNAQSVANELISCDVSLRKGLIRVKQGGGGSFKVNGGNIEMHPHTTDTTDHFIIRVEQNANLGQGNCDYNLTDVRVEIHGANKKLVKTYEDTIQVNVSFTRVAIGTVTGGERTVVEITPTKKVSFDNCILHKDLFYKVYGVWSSSGGSPSNAQLFFDKCDVGRAEGKNLDQRIIKEGNAYRIIATKCFSQSSAVGYSVIPQDFDYGWKAIAPKGVPATKKVVPIKISWLSFPFSNGSNEMMVTLPSDVYVSKIYIKKPYLETSADNYQIHIGNSNKSIILGSSTLAEHFQEHVINLNELGELSFNTLRLWATGTANVAQVNGVGYIEYI